MIVIAVIVIAVIVVIFVGKWGWVEMVRYQGEEVATMKQKRNHWMMKAALMVE